MFLILFLPSHASLSHLPSASGRGYVLDACTVVQLKNISQLFPHDVKLFMEMDFVQNETRQCYILCYIN
jgi:hypothetical protein